MSTFCVPALTTALKKQPESLARLQVLLHYHTFAVLKDEAGRRCACERKSWIEPKHCAVVLPAPLSGPISRFHDNDDLTSHAPLFSAGSDCRFSFRMSHTSSLVAIPASVACGGCSSWKTLALTTYSQPSLTVVSTNAPPVSPAGFVKHRLRMPVCRTVLHKSHLRQKQPVVGR